MSISNGTIYASVWKAEKKNDSGTVVEVQMSTSRKNYQAEYPNRTNDEGRKFSYANSSWSFVQFVGEASRKALVEAVADSPENTPVRITIPAGKSNWQKEQYIKNDEKLYPKNPRLTVFDFEYSGRNKATTKPQVAVDAGDEDEIPFD